MTRDRDLVQEGEAIAQINATLERQTGVSDLTLTLRRMVAGALLSTVSLSAVKWIFLVFSTQCSFPAWI